MKHYAFFTYFLLSLFIVTSCSLGDLHEPIVVVDLDDQLELELLQDLTSDGAYIWSISTIDQNICENSILLSKLVESGTNTQMLVIDGLEIPSDCIEERLNKIYSQEQFQWFEGDITVEVNIGQNLISKLFVYRDLDRVAIIGNDSNGISIKNTNLLTIDHSHLWGGIFSNDKEQIELFNALHEAISQANVFVVPSSGNYGYFNLTENKYAFDLESQRMTSQAFAIKIMGETSIDEGSIPDLVANFRASHPEIDFYIMSGNGQRY